MLVVVISVCLLFSSSVANVPGNRFIVRLRVRSVLTDIALKNQVCGILYTEATEATEAEIVQQCDTTVSIVQDTTYTNT